jgi:hypothetical protein
MATIVGFRPEGKVGQGTAMTCAVGVAASFSVTHLVAT